MYQHVQIVSLCGKWKLNLHLEYHEDFRHSHSLDFTNLTDFSEKEVHRA